MSILKNMSNLLFGQTNTTQEETSQMLAARMQSSSKLKLSDSDIKPLEADPLKFSYNYYPQEVGQLGDGHYMKFHIFTNAKSGIESADPDLFTAKNNKGTAATVAGQQIVEGIGKAFEPITDYLTNNSLLDIGSDVSKNISKVFDTEPSQADIEGYAQIFKTGPRDKFSRTHDKLSQSIVLYTPPDVKFKYEAEYENADTGILGQLAGSDSFMNTAMSSGMAGIAELVVSALQIVSPGVGGLLGRATGMAINPNMELAFKAVPFRPFSFNYTFAPKNQTELDQVHKIIQSFKFHMLPSMTQEQQFFISPSQFEIEYMYRKQENLYIPKISKCVLRSMDIDYAPGEKFTTLRPDSQGASPQIITMQLNFTEMAIITKESAAAGY